MGINHTKHGLKAKEMCLCRLWQDMMKDWIQDNHVTLKSLSILHWYVCAVGCRLISREGLSGLLENKGT